MPAQRIIRGRENLLREIARSQSEQAFQTELVAYVRERGWRVHHCRPARDRTGRWATHIQGDPGFFDLVLMREGEVWFIEAKSESGRLRSDQEAWRAQAPHGRAFVARPSQWDLITELLR